MENPDAESLTHENWTEEQLKAITCRGANTLVSAAAGSGKTKVLVERVLRKISDPKEELEIDKLLIVTFTNAAAAEMKQRIAEELEQLIKKNPGASHLRKQLLLLNQSSICTIHSFCRDVIKNYYYLRGVDPSHRVMEETEAELLRHEALENLLEEAYEKHQPGDSFYQLVNIYSNERGDHPLQELIQNIYDFSRSHLRPEEWLQKNVSAFDLMDKEQLKHTPWLKNILSYCCTELEKIIKMLQRGVRLASRSEGPQPYLANLQQSLNDLMNIYNNFESNSFEEISEAFKKVSFNRLSPCSGEDYDHSLKEKVSSIYNSCKKEFYRLKQEIFERSLDEHVKDISDLSPLIKTIVYLVNDFTKKYEQAKEERGVMDFPDLEHQALKLLTDPGTTSSIIIPSEAARNYLEHFQEVLVDEYQDINQIQETILNLIAGDKNTGRLFMVGDVKQSIYRFRLAEPKLFMEKYKLYSSPLSGANCITLSSNFRCSQNIVGGINYLFKQIMDVNMGEVDYNDASRLIYGGVYPQETGFEKSLLTSEPTLFLIDRSGDENKVEEAEKEDSEHEIPPEYQEEWENAELEGQLIARKIKELTGEGGDSPSLIYDREERRWRPVNYGDIVILLRSAQNWSSSILEELNKEGIPAFSEFKSGYFDSVEVQVIVSLLKIIDNPYQDFSFAAVLRSPIVGLSAEELAKIRMAAPNKYFYDAFLEFLSWADNEETTGQEQNVKLGKMLRNFHISFIKWRNFSRDYSLSELIWTIYLDSSYYELVGGMPGGEQRQANLRLLFQKARQYESTSYRGLFNFLRFIQKLKEHGGETPSANYTGEQEQLVRILTVHKSKGLEFPVVFLAGLSKEFNTRDLKRNFLLHKDWGVGPKYINPELRLSYPTLPWMSIKNSLKHEMLSEEMRILYVAMTRAEQKLYLIGTVKDLSTKLKNKWEDAAKDKELRLPKYYRSEVKSLLDWVAPVVMRHPNSSILREMSEDVAEITVCEGNSEEDCSWHVQVISSQDLIPCEMDKKEQDSVKQEKVVEKDNKEEWLQKIVNLDTLPTNQEFAKDVEKKLSFKYPFKDAATSFAKISVSELKRLQRAGLPGDDSIEPPWGGFSPPRLPKFLNKEGLSPSERGTAYHAVMQYLNLKSNLNEEDIKKQLDDMVQKEQITLLEKEVVDPEIIMSFFRTALGQRILEAPVVMREVPFTLKLSASTVHSIYAQGLLDDLNKINDDFVLVQGVIDCVWREKNELFLLDFKTDAAEDKNVDILKERYRFQIECYSLAVGKIWKEKLKASYLYFFYLQKYFAI